MKHKRNNPFAATFERNAIVNGVQSSIKHTYIPDVKELVTGGDKNLEELFDQAKEDGNRAYEKMLENIKLSMLKRQGKE